jgi:hypothetical protein
MHGMHATIGDAFTCICAQGLLLGRAHAPDSLGAQVNNMPASPVICGSVSNLIAPYDAPSFHSTHQLVVLLLVHSFWWGFEVNEVGCEQAWLKNID